MSANDPIVKPPTGGSALLQMVAAALRQESMGIVDPQQSFHSEDDEDMVHVDEEDKEHFQRMLFRQESTHGLGIHSDEDDDEEDESDYSGVEGHQRRYQHQNQHQHQNQLQHQKVDSEASQPERGRTKSKDGDISISISTSSLGLARDKKTIAQKLQAAFGFSELEEFVEEYSCWLARSVLLRGYMYLTTNHICFYAKLPRNQDVIQREGFFSKKSSTTKQFTRYWFILKNDVLSYYSNQTDVYYPVNTIDLKDALSAEPSATSQQNFHIFTNHRKYTFRTDSELARSDWVKSIQKCIFQAKLEGNKVKIAIPLGNVLEVEMNTMAFAEAIHVRFMENEESFAVEEYYFAYFNDTAKALATLKAQIKKYQLTKLQDPNRDRRVIDNTSPSVSIPKGLPPSAHSTMTEASTRSSRSSFLASPLKLLHTDILRPLSRSSSPNRSHPPSDTEDSDKDKSRHSALSFSIRGSTSWITDRADTTATNDTVAVDENEAFRKEFSLPDSEVLSAVVSGYLLRIVPLYGQVYLSDNYLCYKSRFYGTRTKVIVPLADVQEVSKHKGTRFYFHGLSVLTMRDEEIFFEFSTTETRNTILSTLLDRTTPEAQQRRTKLRAQSIAETPSAELGDPIESRITDSLQLHEEPVHVEPLSWASHPGKTSRPMHITCLTIGSRGDVQPYIALCKRLMKDGHKCRISTHAEYKDWIEGHGIEFGLVGGDPGELIELCVENGMFTVSFIREGLKRFRGWLDELLETAWQSCQNTDVLIESPSAMAGIHIAERLDIPYFRAFPFPWTRTRAFPHPFAVPEHSLGRSYNYMTYVMIEQVFWKGISGQVNRWRKDAMGLGPTTLEKMDPHHVPSLYSWSPNLVPAPSDWHSWVHVTGYWFLDNPDLSWTPPDDLVAFLNADPDNKPVYIGFGSMVVPDPDGMTRTIIDAVVKSGVRVIISKGWSDRLTSQDDPASTAKKAASEDIVYPPSVYMLKSVPHDWLFPQLAGCVHHGGAGTAAAGLRAGIPTVIKPFFGDQYFWAQRVEDAGVGVWMHDLSAKRLTAALITITTDQKMIRKAKLIGEKIRQEDGVGQAIQFLYHDLALAKQRLHKHSKDKSEDTPVNFKVQEGEDDWWFVHQTAGASGSDTAAAGPNTLSSSDDEAAMWATSEHTMSHSGVFTDIRHSATYQGEHTRNDLEPLSDAMHPSATEPGPDRATEMMTHNDSTAEEMAAKLEAMNPPSRTPLTLFGQSFGEAETGWYDKDKSGNVSSSSTGSGSGNRLLKRASGARKMIETLTSKATHMTGYFNPVAILNPQGSRQATPEPSSATAEILRPASVAGGEQLFPHDDGQHQSGGGGGGGSVPSRAGGGMASGEVPPPGSSKSHKSTVSIDANDPSKLAANVTTSHQLR
ncbi:Sterol 3-beta-glucosyltransferase [Dissophora globulifera]|uniref:Sterol 3-beta-glucosyltransferase n=1 Tax=Dissophora globulifera TaxID=979702 RepID=A0A9P6UZ90_9FUNG|nr:Sterol 3-beta-glucosyltransferase [Dissophora globulifera]